MLIQKKTTFFFLFHFHHIYKYTLHPSSSIHPLHFNLSLLSLSVQKSLQLARSLLQINKMENNLPIITKRVWNMIRVALFMLRKGISKGKLMMDLNMMLKRRRKLAGKAITNLIFPHHHGSSTSREYEFSCSNTPNYKFVLNNKRHHRNNHFFACAHAPLTQEDDIVTVNAVKTMLENIVNNHEVMVEASPALPGFGRTPKARQLRVTDSPFPVDDTDTVAEVDKAAEAFIKRFYSQLRKQD